MPPTIENAPARGQLLTRTWRDLVLSCIINPTILELLGLTMFTAGIDDVCNCWRSLEWRPKADKMGRSGRGELTAFLLWILAST
jgi:hypothetical protein